MRYRNRARTAAAATVLAAAAVLAPATGLAAPTGLASPTGPASPAQRSSPGPPQPAECCWATGANEAKVGGDYGDQDYSSLGQLTPANVHLLGGAWLDHVEGGARTAEQESTPVAVGGDLYLQTGQGDVFAVNGATGKVIWEYKSGFPGLERGVAVGDGRVFAALGGEHVVALNQQTGALIWVTQVGTAGQDGPANDGATDWALYVKGLVLVGTRRNGAPRFRAHLYALQAGNGSLAWKFAGTAGPGQPGHDTWAGNSWKTGGADMWMAPAVDPQLGLVYVAVAEPQQTSNGTGRAGDDLYTSSLVALHLSTGKLAWYFQSVHHGLWDYDNTMSPVIADVRYGTGVRKVVIYGSKSGWLFYLDAKTGTPAIQVTEKKVPQLAAQATSPTQPEPMGNSLVPVCPKAGTSTAPIPDFTSGCEYTPFLHSAVLTTPGDDGGGNWALMSFDRQTGLLYVAATEMNSAYSDGQPYGQPAFWHPAGEFSSGVLDAVNPATNTVAWQLPTEWGTSDGAGITTTASGLLFEGSPDGLLSAYNASTGKVLWSFQTGTGIATTPITYMAGGEQYVAVFAGGDYAPYGSKPGDSLWAFRLGGTVPQAAPPAPLPARMPVVGPTVAGSAVNDTVLLGRTWNTKTGAPNQEENLASEVAMAPPIMTVPSGTAVTFTNPAGNTKDHCAESFFDPSSFTIGPLKPGQSGSVTLSKPGDYFYNDCAGFPWDTGEIIVS
jgi:PQQ-dependent dehydrogenase (methanol/ethanol family)